MKRQDKRNLNKKQVIEEMIRLEQLTNANPQKAAVCYYQLANAWYNMSWYGKNWMMVRQWWSSNDTFYNKKISSILFIWIILVVTRQSNIIKWQCLLPVIKN